MDSTIPIKQRCVCCGEWFNTIMTAMCFPRPEIDNEIRCKKHQNVKEEKFKSNHYVYDWAKEEEEKREQQKEALKAIPLDYTKAYLALKEYLATIGNIWLENACSGADDKVANVLNTVYRQISTLEENIKLQKDWKSNLRYLD